MSINIFLIQQSFKALCKDRPQFYRRRMSRYFILKYFTKARLAALATRSWQIDRIGIPIDNVFVITRTPVFNTSSKWTFMAERLRLLHLNKYNAFCTKFSLSSLQLVFVTQNSEWRTLSNDTFNYIKEGSREFTERNSMSCSKVNGSTLGPCHMVWITCMWLPDFSTVPETKFI